MPSTYPPELAKKLFPVMSTRFIPEPHPLNDAHEAFDSGRTVMYEVPVGKVTKLLSVAVPDQ